MKFVYYNLFYFEIKIIELIFISIFIYVKKRIKKNKISLKMNFLINKN